MPQHTRNRTKSLYVERPNLKIGPIVLSPNTPPHYSSAPPHPHSITLPPPQLNLHERNLMARPRRSQGMRNLRSAGLSLANSTVRTTGNIASKAIVSTFKWAATDHSGMGRAMSNLPLLGLGFIGSIKYILSSFFIAIAGAVLTGVWIFLLIGYGIPYLIMGHF